MVNPFARFQRQPQGDSNEYTHEGEDRTAPLDPTDVNESADDLKGKSQGVAKAEASRQATSGPLFITIIIGVLLTSYVAGLDNNTTYAYQTAATSTFGKYNLYAPVIQVVQQIVIAVGKFPVAKISDVFGRAQGYTLSLALWIIGFIILAASQNFGTVVAGTVIYAFGNTGIQIMQQIILADYISSRWRGFAIGVVSYPYLINFACAPLIVDQLAPFSVRPPSTWRWGPGSFAIIAPIAVAPVLLALAISQHKGRKADLVPRHPYFSLGAFEAFKRFSADMDLGCLILIAAGFILILLPLGLHDKGGDSWDSSYIIAMFVIGGVCIIGIGLWEWLVASRPIMRLHYFLNKNIIIPAFFIGFFDFMAFYLCWIPAYTWSFAVLDFNNKDASYYSNIQTLCLTVFGIAAGAIVAWCKRYKWILFAGCCIRMLGIGLMIRYRQADSSVVQVVWPQILQGMGGGMMGITLQVAAQVNVRHQYTAMVTAFVLLLTEIGGACGSAILGTLQSSYLLPSLEENLSQVGVNSTMIATVYGNPFAAIDWPLGSPERDAFVRGWNHYVHSTLVLGIAVSAVPIIASLFITDRVLGKGQNAISDEMAPGHLGSRDQDEPQQHQSSIDEKQRPESA